MSCITSEQNLRDRKAYARSRGWDWIPRFKIVDAECPYCGTELAFEYDYEGIDETEDECPSCGKVFDLTIEWVPEYQCTAKEEGDERK